MIKNDMTYKFKARLVVCVYSQVYGIDYSETYSRTTPISTIFMLMHIGASLNLFTAIFDVTALSWKELMTSSSIVGYPKDLVSMVFISLEWRLLKPFMVKSKLQRSGLIYCTLCWLKWVFIVVMLSLVYTFVVLLTLMTICLCVYMLMMDILFLNQKVTLIPLSLTWWKKSIMQHYTSLVKSMLKWKLFKMVITLLFTKTPISRAWNCLTLPMTVTQNTSRCQILWIFLHRSFSVTHEWSSYHLFLISLKSATIICEYCQAD